MTREVIGVQHPLQPATSLRGGDAPPRRRREPSTFVGEREIPVRPDNSS